MILCNLGENKSKMTIKMIKNGLHLVRFTVLTNISQYQKFLPEHS
jgi:hypothetical protein